MATIETQQQADELNARGEIGPYRAANGHQMIAPVNFPRTDNPRRPTRDYQIGDSINYSSWDAYCAPSCAACRDGEALPDW